jgi:eukaryotic-like serine/threonine-protein kinase
VALSAGTRLGPYEIIAKLGEGGMGEVWKARDTRLDRGVAIKVLPASLALDPAFRARFDREARTISQLSHPHICALYDVGEHDGTPFLVMALLEGQTLAERLESGPLPTGQALNTAIEIASALTAAHRAGIVHRDLKPGNVILTKTGAKLLDFGLAKTNAPVVAVSGSMTPTTAPRITVQGAILGTFQYMAPEQIEGLDADARTDLFAFGCVLFEMVTGRKTFEGKTPASVLGAILKDEPPRVSAVQPLSPPSLDRIASACLAKDPDDRYQSARDLLRDLQWIAADTTAESGSAPRRRSTTERLVWMVTAVALLALVASSVVAMRHFRETPVKADRVQLSIAPPENATFATLPGSGGTGLAPQIAVSPDGRQLVFVGRGRNGYQLWLRPLAAAAASGMPGTEDASFPFWSPDNRSVGFFANGKLKRVLVAGGAPIVVCDALFGRGGTWNRDNVILFASVDAVLHRVSATGGMVQTASVLDNAFGGSSQHRFPFFLPDGRHFLFTEIIGACCPPPRPGRIRVGTLDSMDTRVLVDAESSSAYASGHLLFNRSGTLMAQPFDAESRQFTDDAFPVADEIANEGSRYASFSVSGTGVLVLASGVARPTTRLTWMDRSGRQLGTIGDAAAYLGLALSNDERRVAVTLAKGSPENRDIYILDVRQQALGRFTFDVGLDNSPVWSPDDRTIVFQASREGLPQLRQRRVDGTGEEESLVEFVRGEATATFPMDWSADGQYLLYLARGLTTSRGLFALPFFGDRKPFLLMPVSVEQSAGAVISPNGRWFAYQSSDGGQYQVLVRAFPQPRATFQISKDGGSHPVWRRDGKELFFLSADSKMMAASVETAGQFQAGPATPLFTVATPTNVITGGRQYAVTQDGRFLINVIQQQTTVTPLTVVINWLTQQK